MSHDFPQISAIETLAALASPIAPVLLDIRLPEHLAEDPTCLPGAVAVPFEDIERQVSLATPNGAVVICHRGLKLSVGVTARLRRRGLNAWRLFGGHLAWTDAGLATVDGTPSDIIALSLDATPKEVLATWATLRFISPRADLLEVPSVDLPGVVERFGAGLAGPLPDLPGLALLDTARPALELSLRSGPPSASFPMLDQVYKGALRQVLDAGSVAA